MAYPRRSSTSTSSLHENSDQITMKRKPSPAPPPSSFFPFQAYAGNPDPGLPIPRTGSMSDLTKPVAPFMLAGQQHSPDSLSRVSSSNSLYKQSAAGIPRNPSVQSFRAPFLSPSSRPTSSLWSPPSYPTLPNLYSVPSAPPSSSALPLALPKSKPPLPSTALTQPLQANDKPWLARTQPGTYSSYFITLACILLGAIAAAILAFMGYMTVPLLKEKNLCLVLDDQFSQASLDDSVWNYDVQLANAGFGPSDPIQSQGQSGFQMSTKSSDNLYLSNSNLYIVPTLSSDRTDSSTNFSLSGCTSQDPSQCTASGNAIPPIMSARIHTKSKKNIRFGKVSIRAKLPVGDWLHPHVYLLPENETYGPYPTSGQIDIIEARGNGMGYEAQGGNFIKASLDYGPMESLKNEIYGWFGMKRSLWGTGFHDYVLEWDQSFIRVYVDKRTQSLLEIPIGPLSPNPFSHSSASSFYFSSGPILNKPSFWSKGAFPSTIPSSSLPINSSSLYPPGTEIPLQNPYHGASYAAPFDQKFYLVIELAVGGTSGWFPDGVGGKPWFDGEGGEQAMKDFANAQGTWHGTWPGVGGKQESALRIEHIKMWEKC